MDKEIAFYKESVKASYINSLILGVLMIVISFIELLYVTHFQSNFEGHYIYIMGNILVCIFSGIGGLMLNRLYMQKMLNDTCSDLFNWFMQFLNVYCRVSFFMVLIALVRFNKGI